MPSPTIHSHKVGQIFQIYTVVYIDSLYLFPLHTLDLFYSQSGSPFPLGAASPRGRDPGDSCSLNLGLEQNSSCFQNLCINNRAWVGGAGNAGTCTGDGGVRKIATKSYKFHVSSKVQHSQNDWSVVWCRFVGKHFKILTHLTCRNLWPLPLQKGLPRRQLPKARCKRSHKPGDF